MGESSNVGNNVKPPVEDTVRNDLNGYSNNADWRKLFPKAGLGNSPSYSKVFDLITNRVQLARQALSESPSELAAVRYAGNMIHGKRVQDSAPYRISGVNQELSRLSST